MRSRILDPEVSGDQEVPSKLTNFIVSRSFFKHLPLVNEALP